jgi:hypothetical protein
MFVLNVLLAIFFVRTEVNRPAAPGISTPSTLERQKPSSSPQLSAPANQESSLSVKSPPVEARPDPLLSTRRAERPAAKILRAGKTPRPDLSAPKPWADIHPPQETLGHTPAPVRDPSASSGASANVAPPGVAASFAIPAAGVHSNAAQHSTAPAASALARAAIGHGLTAQGTRAGSMAKVAPVGLPGVEKGLVRPKMPVAPALHIEIVPRPVKVAENCGDDKVFIACPELKNRYDTPYTSEAP